MSDDMEAMQRELDLALQANGEFSEEIKRLAREREELIEKKFARFADDECWIWQGDGTDDLESLVCPIVISPEQMRSLELARLAIEFDAASDDYAWPEGHPIFKMAQHIDDLNALVRKIRDIAAQNAVDTGCLNMIIGIRNALSYYEGKG